MSIIAYDGVRFSAVVKREFDPAMAFCRDAVTYNGTAVTLQVGAVLGAFIASPVATPGVVVGTGNGTISAVTAASVLGLEIGNYIVKLTSATAFELLSATARVMGVGIVGTAFNQVGLTFTVTAGATPFIQGDYFPLAVTGTVKYKLCEATATDGSQFAKVIYLADQIGLSHPLLTVVNTDTVLLVMSRGPAIVDASQLSFGASVTGNALTIALAQLKSVGIVPETQV